MDTIVFEKYILHVEHPEKDLICAEILLNGIPLIDIARDYELPYARKYGQENIAGGYMPMYADYLYGLLTNRTKSEEYDGEIPVLICQCGYEGCWDLLVTAADEGSSVVWSRFHNPNRSSKTSPGGFWDYEHFPTYRFEKGFYQEALGRLREMAR